MDNYLEIPDNAISLELISNDGDACYCCNYCSCNPLCKFEIWSNFKTGFNHLIWESSEVEYDDLDQLRNEVIAACKYYNLKIDFSKIIYAWDFDENSVRMLTDVN